MTTLKRIEPGVGPLRASEDVLIKIAQALESAGVELVSGDDAKGIGVRLARPSDRDRLDFMARSIRAAVTTLHGARVAARESALVGSLDRAIEATKDAERTIIEMITYDDDFSEAIDDGIIDGIDRA